MTIAVEVVANDLGAGSTDADDMRRGSCRASLSCRHTSTVSSSGSELRRGRASTQELFLFFVCYGYAQSSGFLLCQPVFCFFSFVFCSSAIIGHSLMDCLLCASLLGDVIIVARFRQFCLPGKATIPPRFC